MKLKVMVIDDDTGEKSWIDLEQEAEGFYHAAVAEILAACGVEERHQRAAYLCRVIAERIKQAVQTTIFPGRRFLPSGASQDEIQRRIDAQPPASR